MEIWIITIFNVLSLILTKNEDVNIHGITTLKWKETNLLGPVLLITIFQSMLQTKIENMVRTENTIQIPREH